MTAHELQAWAKSARPGERLAYGERDFRRPLPDPTGAMVAARALYDAGSVALVAELDRTAVVAVALNGNALRRFRLLAIKLHPGPADA